MGHGRQCGDLEETLLSGTEQEMAVLRGGKGKSLVSCGQGAGAQWMGSWDRASFLRTT